MSTETEIYSKYQDSKIILQSAIEEMLKNGDKLGLNKDQIVDDIKDILHDDGIEVLP